MPADVADPLGDDVPADDEEADQEYHAERGSAEAEIIDIFGVKAQRHEAQSDGNPGPQVPADALPELFLLGIA